VVKNNLIFKGTFIIEVLVYQESLPLVSDLFFKLINRDVVRGSTRIS